MSILLSSLGIKLNPIGNLASLNKKENGWLVIVYGNNFYGGGMISQLSELKGKKIASLRIKQHLPELVEPDLMTKLMEIGF